MALLKKLNLYLGLQILVYILSLSLYIYFIDEILLISLEANYVNFPDATENIKNAYFLSKLGRLNQYTISNHVPGVYFFLGIIYQFLGVFLFSPSVPLLVGLNFISMLIVLLVQMVCLNYSYFLITFKFLDSKKSIIVTCLITYLHIFFDYHRVLSETILPFVNLLSLSFFYRSLITKNKSKYLYYSLFYRLLSLFLGLTNFIFDIIFLIILLGYSIKKRTIPYSNLGFSLGVLLLLLLYLYTDSFSDYYYWIVETNSQFSWTQVPQNIQSLPNTIFRFHSFGMFTDSPFYFLIFTLWYSLLYKHKKKSIVLYFGILVLLFPFDSWRYAETDVLNGQSYKTDSNMAIGILGFLYIVNLLKNDRFNYYKILLPSLMFYNILIFPSSSFLKLNKEIQRNKSNHISFLELSKNKNLCYQNFLETKEECKCVITLYWNQDIYLHTNIKPCKYLFSSHSPHLNDNQKYVDLLISSMEKENHSFLVYDYDIYNPNSFWLHPKMIKKIKELNCEHKDALMLCFGGTKRD